MYEATVGRKYVQNGRKKEYTENSSSQPLEAFSKTCIQKTEELQEVMMMCQAFT